MGSPRSKYKALLDLEAKKTPTRNLNPPGQPLSASTAPAPAPETKAISPSKTMPESERTTPVSSFLEDEVDGEYYGLLRENITAPANSSSRLSSDMKNDGSFIAKLEKVNSKFDPFFSGLEKLKECLTRFDKAKNEKDKDGRFLFSYLTDERIKSITIGNFFWNKSSVQQLLEKLILLSDEFIRLRNQDPEHPVEDFKDFIDKIDNLQKQFPQVKGWNEKDPGFKMTLKEPERIFKEKLNKQTTFFDGICKQVAEFDWVRLVSQLNTYSSVTGQSQSERDRIQTIASKLKASIIDFQTKYPKAEARSVDAPPLPVSHQTRLLNGK